MSSIKSRLKKAQQEWKDAKKEADEQRGFNEYDDGRYIVKLTNAEVAESQSSDRLQVVWTWTFQEGDYEGKDVRDFDGLETESNLMWLARKFARLGYDAPDDLAEELSDMLGDLVEDQIVARVRLKTKGDFQNLYVDKVISVTPAGDDTDEGPAETTEPEEEETEPEETEPEEEETEPTEEATEEDVVPEKPKRARRVRRQRA
jgi:hypothetical protein